VTVPGFDRHFFRSEEVFSRIGGGSLGGKAEGLIRIRDRLYREIAGHVDGIEVAIPRVVVLATDPFDAFMRRNQLDPETLAELSDARVAHAFQRADLPSEVLGDLRSLAQEAHQPLAVRSSSMLEDALERPFAGIYETKMIPNNQPDPGTRFRRLVEAVKLIYASTYFQNARTYRKAVGIAESDEKMAVAIQEIVGERHGGRFYPHLSAVCRSYSYYPIGRSKPEDGVVSLALGLGKTIVDGGLCWSYSPRRPKTPRPFGSVQQMVAESQARFWAVNMGKTPAYDPVEPAEYLLEADLAAAEYDGVLRHLASTYDPESDRLRPGVHGDGARVLDFAPLLQLREWPLNNLMKAVLAIGEDVLGTAAELELAMTLPEGRDGSPRAGVVQLRPMRAPGAVVELAAGSLDGPGVLIATDGALGNGVEDGIRDVVYVRRDRFEARHTRDIAGEVARLNRRLVDEGRPYLLVGFGRWGSSDPWLGIPVAWGEVSGARAIVEATLPSMDVEPSQGSHFFHNLSSTGALYFTVRHGATPGIDWERLDGEPAESETEWVRHLRLESPLRVAVDGRTGRGVVRFEGSEVA
jgi:hypothetical protein